MVIPLKESKDPNAKAALARLEQIKNQLNLSPSEMSLQAPKDMAAERAKADFNVDALTRYWYGGDKKYELVNKAFNIIKEDPDLIVQPPRNFLEFSKDEIREYTMRQVYRLAQIKLNKEYDQEMEDEIFMAVKMYSPSLSMRLFVHDSLFRNVVNMLGNKEQQDKWNDDIDNYRIFGCFAMTELGHSSALRELETTATYDPNTDEFVIESPSVTSTKWYIGAACSTATHTVVISQTVINGKKVGLNWFVVQLREKGTGKLMPNVIAGDIGPKVGHQGVDNGWIQFKNLRIPRTNMLAKWVSLDRQGNYTPAPNPAVMYATLIPERLSLIDSTNAMISQVVTIATRYGVARRQGNKNQQIMDYQSHYVKLIPAIAFMYILRSAGRDIYQNFDVLTSGGKIDDPIFYLNHMSEMHCVSASVKALSGWYATEILETCRRSAGGHAYSQYNAIGTYITDWGVMTGAGDNVVLLQQSAKLLLHSLKQRLEYEQFPELKFKSSSHYINDAPRLLALKQWDVTDIQLCARDASLIEEALNATIVKRLHSINESLNKGLTHDDLLLECVRVAELYCSTYLFTCNVAKFGLPQPSNADVDPSVHKIMQKLTILWGVHTLHTYADEAFKEGFISPQQSKDIESLYLDLNKELRYQVIGLTDAFGFPDFILKAPIGKYDGDIYQSYFETILQAPKSVGVPDYHDKYIKPLTSRTAK